MICINITLTHNWQLHATSHTCDNVIAAADFVTKVLVCLPGFKLSGFKGTIGYCRKQLKGSMKEPNKFYVNETEKITRKAVTWQNISSCSVLSPEIVMHDAFNVILWTLADICVVVHDDLGWKNRTTRCNRFWRAGCSRLEYVDIRLVY